MVGGIGGGNDDGVGASIGVGRVDDEVHGTGAWME